MSFCDGVMLQEPSEMFAKAVLSKRNIQVIKKFPLTAAHRDNYEAFKEKLRESFPSLANKGITITYKDIEDDDVLISNNEELQQAIRDSILMKKPNFRVDIMLKKTKCAGKTSHQIPGTDVVHSTIACDGCGNIIKGFRYKCLQCFEYDLCSACESTGKHSQHCMLRLVRPVGCKKSWNQFLRKAQRWVILFEDGLCSTQPIRDNENIRRQKSMSKQREFERKLQGAEKQANQKTAQLSQEKAEKGKRNHSMKELKRRKGQKVMKDDENVVECEVQVRSPADVPIEKEELQHAAESSTQTKEEEIDVAETTEAVNYLELETSTE